VRLPKYGRRNSHYCDLRSWSLQHTHTNIEHVRLWANTHAYKHTIQRNHQCCNGKVTQKVHPDETHSDHTGLQWAVFRSNNAISPPVSSFHCFASNIFFRILNAACQTQPTLHITNIWTQPVKMNRDVTEASVSNGCNYRQNVWAGGQFPDKPAAIAEPHTGTGPRRCWGTACYWATSPRHYRQ
jgi:hypothetical protein